MGSVLPLHTPTLPQAIADKSNPCKTPLIAREKQCEVQQHDMVHQVHGFSVACIYAMGLSLSKTSLGKACFTKQMLQETCKAQLQPQGTAWLPNNALHRGLPMSYLMAWGKKKSSLLLLVDSWGKNIPLFSLFYYYY